MSRAPGVSFPTACAAPHVNLHLDPHGVARACCENKHHVLGRVPDRSLAEIWAGEQLARLRVALAHDDLDLGCEGCEQAIRSGDRATARVGMYDHDVVTEMAPPRPVRLDLELSNRCNLQCVMCNGELSSSIRTHREGRPPLPKVYDDRFFDELATLAPHLTEVGFLGGEPFLGSEPLRAFEVLAANGFRGRCHVTTNGTVYNRRVEAILDALDVDISISIDGMSAETVEAVRVGAHHRELMANVERFRAKAAERDTSFFVHYCVLRENWHELHPFLVWAEQIDAGVCVIPVRHPMTRSLDTLDADSLAAILSDLRRQEAEGPALGRHRHAWDVEVARLQAIEARLRSSSTEVPVSVGAGPDHEVRSLESWADGRGVTAVLVSSDGIVEGAEPDIGDVLGMDLHGLVGAHGQELLAPLRERFGTITRSTVRPGPAGCEVRTFQFADSPTPATVRVVLVAAAPTTSGRWHMAAREGLHD